MCCYEEDNQNMAGAWGIYYQSCMCVSLQHFINEQHHPLPLIGDTPARVLIWCREEEVLHILIDLRKFDLNSEARRMT